ncbi:MAG: hypothetical protein KA120_09730 [Candidatus Goldbacteria bacterium]|nr:hypothetical protein [Candidatus Goldiibacteriota bacterium]
MKKLIFSIFTIFILCDVVSAGPWKSYSEFQKYLSLKNAAKQAEAEGDTFNAVSNYLKAAEVASKSADANIQAWQLNNAAYSLISRFKKLTDYDQKLKKLTGMQPSKEKIAYQKEFAEMLNLQFPLLQEAQDILEKTKNMGEELEAKEKITSNLDFIAWVKDFITTNLNGDDENKQVKEESTTKSK